MREIGTFDAETTLGALLDRVEQGEEGVITRNGKPVARLVPEGAAKDGQTARAAAERIRARAKDIPRDEAISIEEWKQFRNEGRA
ncbi:type II toxin-antitoxin system Phd/YefM family antitoxin [Aquibium microcysteis]|uniref:type II toxin-antitoxin system Phd/YefM family antitoxin n=1 Tax=Aquibium microcysteis TaxID=675281 RepID=UPI00165CF5F6|nr:type II toxin-antitoxin system prevent-host-death family antitoxin [Aquibium microcysteis]